MSRFNEFNYLNMAEKVPAEKPESDSKQPTKVAVKRGDYQVHIFLEEARSLIPKEEGDTVDPIISITCLGKKKYTKPKDDVGGTAAVYWGDHFFFTGKNLEPEDVENERILIEVKDHRFMLSDSLIGNYEMDLSYIYY
jgi:hypothetical protein